MQISLMVIMGHRVQEISEKLSLSPKTVNSYRYRVFDKLHVRNDVGLTRMAIKHGIKASQLAEFLWAYPTYSSALKSREAELMQ